MLPYVLRPFILPWCLLLLLSCSNNESAQSTAGGGDFAAEADQELLTEPPRTQQPPSPPGEASYTEEQQPGGTIPEPTPRQIIRRAEYRIQVDSVEASGRHVTEAAKERGGYVSETNLTNSNYELGLSMTIRVPADNFDALLADIAQEAVFTNYRRVSSDDVTEEYVDIQTRLATKKAVRDRYVEILRNKAKTVQEVLAAEEAIRAVQEEIEAREARLKYLTDQVAMSSIHLEMYQPVDYRAAPELARTSFWYELGQRFRGGWVLIKDLLLFLVNIWPLLLLGVGLWFLWKWIRVRRQARVTSRESRAE